MCLWRWLAYTGYWPEPLRLELWARQTWLSRHPADVRSIRSMSLVRYTYDTHHCRYIADTYSDPDKDLLMKLKKPWFSILTPKPRQELFIVSLFSMAFCRDAPYRKSTEQLQLELRLLGASIFVDLRWSSWSSLCEFWGKHFAQRPLASRMPSCQLWRIAKLKAENLHFTSPQFNTRS